MHTIGRWVVEKRKVGFRINSKVERKVHSHPLEFKTTYYKVADVYYEENAKRIVQMHNSFDGLLEACNKTIELMDSIDFWNRNSGDASFVALHDGIQDAIAEAEVK